MADAECVGRPEVGRVIPNAPSRLPERKRLFHTPPPWVAAGEVFFITICCSQRKTNQLASAAVFSVMSGAVEHYVQNDRFWCHLFLAMPDHLHALCSFPRHERRDRLVRDGKRFVAKQAKIVWQEGFFDHRLRSNDSFEEKAHYIRMNPVRANLVATPEKWPFVWPAYASAAAR